jgi:hypothetical protein
LPEIVRIPTNFRDYIANRQGRTLLKVAVTYSSCEVILMFIKNKVMLIVEDVLKAAAGNKKSRGEVIKLLL